MIRLRWITYSICAAAVIVAFSFAHAQDIYRSHALSLHNDIKYGSDFKHFDYVNPNAPKGGEARMAELGTFDSLNPFILKGVPAAGLGLFYSTLLTASLDEANTAYGNLVEFIEMPEDMGGLHTVC